MSTTMELSDTEKKLITAIREAHVRREASHGPLYSALKHRLHDHGCYFSSMTVQDPLQDFRPVPRRDDDVGAMGCHQT